MRPPRCPARSSSWDPTTRCQLGIHRPGTWHRSDENSSRIRWSPERTPSTYLWALRLRLAGWLSGRARHALLPPRRPIIHHRAPLYSTRSDTTGRP